MKPSPNERILRSLLIEREWAIASNNTERLAVLNTAIELHNEMILEDARKEGNYERPINF